ncbi:hypothetical protein [Trinickia dinghuensis]|uniref:Proteophosphoglycan ppg4 n=1 Tax=Trinickia dinghuensis TaxID=2291023 RepID=A0A3D8JXC3_9BURK|nr:hypothetical protein [Trinickia dinghuensis]RDU97462.1 hypothetical protein DWV00_18715 [Trinickia dinghuensis]
MSKVTITLIAAAAALTLSNGAFAQNNTLATPTVTSPAAATPAATTSGYGMPGMTNSESGTAMQTSDQANGMNMSTMPTLPANGANNTLATPSVKSPVAQ